MPKRRSPARAIALLAALASLAGGPARAQGSDVTPFTLSTLDTGDGGALAIAQVNDGHGCKGGNAPPSLQWSDPPPGTKGFAVTMVDLSAGGGFWHWAVFDLRPDTRSLAGKTLPDGAKAARNDFGQTGYGGACPPPGPAHRYQLAVWAMPDATVPFDANSSGKEVGAFLAAHALGHADLTLTYKR